MGMGGMGMMMGSSAALVTPPIHPSHPHLQHHAHPAHAAHAHHAMVSAMSPGIAMSPGALWGRGVVGAVGSNFGNVGGTSSGDATHNQNQYQNQSIGDSEGGEQAGSRRGSGAGSFAEPRGYFEGVPIPLERSSSAHIEEDGGYFVGAAPLRTSAEARSQLESEILKGAGGLGRRESEASEGGGNDSRPATRHRSSSGSVHSASETDHDGDGFGERRNSSSVATSWRSSCGSSDALERIKAEYAGVGYTSIASTSASTVFPIGELPKRRAKSKEPRRPPVGGLSLASGSGSSLTRSGAGPSSGKSKSAGASAGTSVDGDLLSGDESLAINLGQLQLQPEATRVYSLSVSDTSGAPIRPHSFHKSHSDETGEKRQAKMAAASDLDAGAGYSFPRTPGNKSGIGKKAPSQTGSTAHTPTLGLSKGVGLGLASGL